MTAGRPEHPGERAASPQGRAPRRAASSGDGDRSADDWRANEIRWLRAQVADLERRLRRRTVALAVALAFGGFVTGAAVGGALVLGDGGAEPGWLGRIADAGPATDRVDAATEQAEAASTEARRQDLVVRALQTANEELEAAIGRPADGPGR